MIEVSSKNVIIVELNPYHDECLYSQCLMVKRMDSEINLTVIVNQKARERIEDTLKTEVDKLIFLPFGSGWQGFVSIIKLYRLVMRTKNLHLHFNTAQGNVAWKLFLLPFPRRIEITGVIHNIQKLGKSMGQKIISRRIDRYMVLSDILLPYYKVACSKPCVSVYPVFYPKRVISPLTKPVGETWVVIPGAIAYERRDYDALFLEENKNYPPGLKFILLGNINCADGASVLENIHRHHMEKSFVIFEEYVPNELFYAYVEACDYIMPLIHPDIPRYAKYLENKISGTYNLAIAYRKVMLCPKEMQEQEDFLDTALFYDKKRIRSFFNNLNADRQEKKLFALEKWTLEYQTRQMKRLIFNE